MITFLIILLIILVIIIFIFNFINNRLNNRLNKEFFIDYPTEYYLPKVIYCYWDNLDENKLIQSHLHTWKRNISEDWKIVILNKNNVSEYVDNKFLKKYIGLPSFRFSDFLRLYLLKNYGGVWMDCASIVTSGNFLNNFYNEMIQNKSDVTVFEFKEKSKKYPYLENWFIMAPKNSKFINDLYNEFAKSFNMGFVNYKKNILCNSGIEVENTLKDRNSDYTYLMQHAIVQYLLDSGKRYNLNIKDAEESMFKVQKINNWKSNGIINFILENNDWTNFYAIKLVKDNRRGITSENMSQYIAKLNSL